MIFILLCIYLYVSNSLLFSRLFFKKSVVFEKEKIGIILFPGYGKSSSCYKDLCKKIEYNLERSNIYSHFIMNDYYNNIPVMGYLQTEHLTKKSIQKLNDKNITKIFFMGHSAGSYFLNNIAEKYGDGFIQMGNVLNSNGILPWDKISLYKYPIPTLTLLGQKDGYTSFLLGLDELNDIQNNNLYKPIIIEKDVNHLQMADNSQTLYADILNKNDIISPLEIEKAHDLLSTSISEFIKCCLNKNYKSYILLNKTQETEKILINYNETTCDLDALTSIIQKEVLETIDISDYKITNNYYNDQSLFIQSKPYVKNNTIHINSYIDEKRMDYNYYSKMIWLKMKNPSHFNNRNIKLKQAGYFNKEIFNKVLYNEKSLDQVKKGPNIVFESDNVYDDGILVGVNWVLSKIKINFNETTNTIFIKSPVLISSSDVPTEKFANMYYMKVLSPQLCYELIHLYF